jgi:muramidase (phage lysozyme)
MVAQCEVGTADKSGYNILYGGGRFESYADHPRTAITAGKYTSTAAGRYQILAGTWNDFIKSQGPHDFSPPNQDLCCRWLIDRRGATADVEAGRLRAAITRCNKEWASLPGSPYGQPLRTLDYCERLFATHGGVQIDGNTVYREERSTPKEPRMGAIAPALLQFLFQAFSARGTAAVGRITGLPEPEAAKAYQVIGSKVAEVAGIPVTDDASAARAVAIVAADPVKVAAVEDVTIHYALVEIGGGVQSARDEYAAINRDYDDDTYGKILAKFVANPVNWVTGVFLFFIQQFVPALAKKVEDLDGAAAMGLIVLVFAVLGVVSARWMGVYPKSKE